MSRLILPSRFLDQPQQPVELVTAFSGGAFFLPPIHRLTAGVGVAPSRVVTQHGAAAAFALGTLTTQDIPFNPNGLSGITLIAVARFGAFDGTNLQGLLTNRITTGAGAYCQLTRRNHSSALQKLQWIYKASSAVSEVNVSFPDNSSPPGAMNTAVVTAGSSALLRTYLDGVRGASTACSPVALANQLTTFRCGTYYSNTTSNSLSADVAMLAILPFEIEPSDAVEISANPWQIFRVPDEVLYFDLGAGGGVTGTISAAESGSDAASLTGNVTISGTIAATEAGADVAAMSGAVSVSGTLAAVETGSDTAAFTGDADSGITGTLAATETGSDSAAMTGTVAVSGTISAAETGADTAAFVGAVAIAGALAATEAGSDTAAFRSSETVAEPEQPAVSGVGGGGSVSWWPGERTRTREERDDERRRLGILPPKVAAVVKAVAQQEAAKPVQPPAAEVRQDLREGLKAVRAQYRAEYLKALYAEIEYQRLQMQAQEEEEEAVVMLMLAMAA